MFAASFSISTATAAIVGGSVLPEDVAELIWSLVDRSLVVADLTANATRYRLLESTQRYGRRLLDESGETVGVATRLAGSLLEGLGPWVPVDRRWVGDAGVELDNLRALVPLVATHQPELAQELACTIGRFHDASQTFRDGIEEVGGYAEALPIPSSPRVSLLTILADLHLRIGAVEPARWLVEDAEALREKHGAPSWDEVGVDRTRGARWPAAPVISPVRWPSRGAGSSGRSAIEGGPACTTCWALRRVPWATWKRPMLAFIEERDLYQDIGYEWGVASAQGNLAEVALRLGDTGAAARHQGACSRARRGARFDHHGRVLAHRRRPAGREWRRLGHRLPAPCPRRGVAGADGSGALRGRSAGERRSCSAERARSWARTRSNDASTADVVWTCRKRVDLARSVFAIAERRTDR